MVLVGVCGGIAAYKSCELVRELVRAGVEVQVVQTRASQRFVGPTTFAALSRRPVLTDDDTPSGVAAHLDATADAALLCIAPLTATTMARIVHGDASTLLAASALAFQGPVVAAPAMNPRMWLAGATRANVAELQLRGVELVGPEVGEMAEDESGPGRMAEPAVIADAVRARLGAGRSLAGRRVLVTAGGTREPLDAVRFLGNRSSGRMGAAVAEEAVRRGAEVTLILTAGSVEPAVAVDLVRVETAADLECETLSRAPSADVVVMAAAVADYRPAAPLAGKRTKDGALWTVELVPTGDVLAQLGVARRPGQVLVGFAAEHGSGALERARAKLERKHVDMIVMNDVSRPGIGFDAANNELVLVVAEGETVVSRRSKRACAAAVWDALQTAGNRRAVTPV